MGEDKEDVIIGNEVASEFESDIKCYRWGRENSLSIAYEGFNGTPDLTNDEVTMSKGSEGMYFKQDGNHLKFGLVFTSKPPKNSWSFKMTGWEDFRITYQPKLTQREIDDGCDRPEDVVGSYAVYHKTNKHNKYKTGKAFHIYRPKFIDSVGKWAWATLDITNGVYTVTVPQSFLNTATYPVKANDTIGVEAQGGSRQNIEGSIRSQDETSSTAGAVTDVRAWVESTTQNKNATMGVFTTADDINRIQTAETVILTGAAHELGFGAGGGYSISIGPEYTIAVWSDASTGVVGCFYDAGAAGTARFETGLDYSGSSGVMPDPWNSSSNTNRDTSNWLVFTPSGAGYGNIVNTVAAANMAKVNTVAKANISTVSGA